MQPSPKQLVCKELYRVPIGTLVLSSSLKIDPGGGNGGYLVSQPGEDHYTCSKPRRDADIFPAFTLEAAQLGKEADCLRVLTSSGQVVQMSFRANVAVLK